MAQETLDEKSWDDFVLAHDGCFLQSWGWSKFQETLGRDVFRCRISDAPDGQHAVAQFVTITHGLPFGRRYLYIPRGPLVQMTGAGDTGRINLETCVRTISARVAETSAIFARVEWPYRKEASPVSAEDMERWDFREAKTMQPADTVIIDLAKDEAALLADMHHKTRYNARVAERHGVTVREAEYGDAAAFERDFDTFWKLLADTAERDEFHTHERAYYRTLLDTLAPSHTSGRLRVRLFFAMHEGEAIAAALVSEFGGTATYLHGASAHAKRQVMAPYLLHWQIMRQMKSAGMRAYDLWGVAPSDDAAHSWAGITRFKTGFGGTRVSYLGAWELPGNPFWYTLYRYAKRFRNV
jgi:peptidoglycan pentaglycine glycine transferase (the first glycine)